MFKASTSSGPPPNAATEPAYLSELVLGRIYFGAFPSAKQDVAYLLGYCGVTHIVNLKPLSGRTTTKSGLESGSYYSQYWDKAESKLSAPTVMRHPLPNVKDTKRKDLVAWYVSTARAIAARVSASDVVFIHHDTGLDEEATLAFILADVLRRGSVSDVDTWIEAHPNAQGVLLSADERQLLREAITQHRATKAQPMDRWVMKKQRIDTE